MTSVNSIGSSPAELSIVRLTSARPSAGRLAVPAKMTSSIFWLRTDLGAWAPSTQAIASTTFDLPEPLGPTTTVTPGSRARVVESANDLKPLRVRLFRNTVAPNASWRAHADPGIDDPRRPVATVRTVQRWQIGQKWVERWADTIRRIQPPPQVRQRSPARP